MSKYVKGEPESKKRKVDGIDSTPNVKMVKGYKLKANSNQNVRFLPMNALNYSCLKNTYAPESDEEDTYYYEKGEHIMCKLAIWNPLTILKHMNFIIYRAVLGSAMFDWINWTFLVAAGSCVLSPWQFLTGNDVSLIPNDYDLFVRG